MKTISDIFGHFKEMRINALEWLSGLFGILFVRFFLEALSNPSANGFFAVDLPTLAHYSLFFIALALFLQIFLRIFLPNLGDHIPKITILAFSGILIAPIVDLLVNGAGGSPMVYVLNSPGGILKSAFYLFSSSPAYGTTIGLQVEITAILLAIMVAIYFLSRDLVKAILGSIFFYAILFILCSTPSILAIFAGEASGPSTVMSFMQNSIESSATLANHLPTGLEFSSRIKMLDTGFNFMLARVFLLISIAFMYLWFRKANAKITQAILNNSRPERVANYIFIIILGIILALELFPNINLNWNDWLSMVSLFLSAYFSILFAICINDIEDLPIDKITNIERPLVKKEATPSDMREASFLFLIISIISGYLAGNLPFFFILVFTALYYIYSAPPTRFKMIPFFSSFIIGLCCVSAFMAGFYFISPLKVVSILPATPVLLVFLFFFLFWHMRDIKDIEGDRKNNIPTVPVLLGKRWGRRITGAISAFSFLTVPFLLNIGVLWVPAILASISTYYFINKDPYSEKPILQIYLLFVIISGIVLFLPTL